MDRRIDVTEVPLVGRQLAVGMGVPLAGKQQQLALGELGIDEGQRQAVKGRIPGGEPGVLPLVRHRQDVRRVDVVPIGIAPMPAFWRWRRLGRIAGQPVADVVVIELLGPDHPGQGLALDQPRIFVGKVVLQVGIEGVGLVTRPSEDGVRVLERLGQLGIGEAQLEGGGASAGDLGAEMCRRLRADPVGIDRRVVAVNDKIVNSVLVGAPAVIGLEDPGGVGLVLARQERRVALAIEADRAQGGVARLEVGVLPYRDLRLRCAVFP